MKIPEIPTYVKILAFWAVWLATGTVFYAIRNELGWSRGWYMTINVGYSIGWGYPVEIDHACMVFSIFNVLVGASAGAAALSYFAKSMIASSKNWYSEALMEESVAHDTNFVKRLGAYIMLHKTQFKAISLWIVWICALVIWSMKSVKWSLTEAFYHAIASYSTGGLYALPQDSPDSYFVIGKVELTIHILFLL
jgi:hypothetical protein